MGCHQVALDRQTTSARMNKGPECPLPNMGLTSAFDPNRTLAVSTAQSIHSSTWDERSDGKDKPSLLSAVRLALMVNWVGPAIGRSAGFAPRRILSTYLAASW